MDVQISVGKQVQFFLVAEAGVGIEKTAQQEKQDNPRKDEMFFHGRVSFFYFEKKNFGLVRELWFLLALLIIL